MVCTNPIDPRGLKHLTSRKQVNLNLEQEAAMSETMPETDSDNETALSQPLYQISAVVYLLTAPFRAIGKYLSRKSERAAYKTTSYLMKNAACIDEDSQK